MGFADIFSKIEISTQLEKLICLLPTNTSNWNTKLEKGKQSFTRFLLKMI